MAQAPKCGNPHRLPKRSRGRHLASAPTRAHRASVLPIGEQPSPIASPERARLSLHACDPITGNEESLYTLFYEDYRGYTIYSTPDGRCCIHTRCGGCLTLQGKFICFPDVEDAKTLIKWFRAEGYTSWDAPERFVPSWVYVRVDRHQEQRQQRLMPGSSFHQRAMS